MFIGLFMSVILFDDTIKKFLKLGIGVMRASITTDAGVKVLNTGEDASLE